MADDAAFQAKCLRCVGSGEVARVPLYHIQHNDDGTYVEYDAKTPMIGICPDCDGTGVLQWPPLEPQR